MVRDPESQVMKKPMRAGRVYDVLCGPVFVNGRRAARAAREVGGRILEIGVGTGLSFDDYDALRADSVRSPRASRPRDHRLDRSMPVICRARSRRTISGATPISRMRRRLARGARGGARR